MLDAVDLRCERGARTLFSGISLALNRGEALHIAGANGSGKTSLLRILCGLLPPAHGEVRWHGTPIRRLGEQYATSIVYVGHAAALKDDLTAAENLAVGCRMVGHAVPRTTIEEALARFGLPANDVLVKRLSQGQRRRAALARLALSEALELWLLDEPFAALDAAGVHLLRGLIEAHRARGGAVAFTTHQEAALAPSRVIDLDRKGP